MNDIKRIERDLLRELQSRGVELTAMVKRQANEVAADMAMVERCRAALNAGETIDFDSYMRLRTTADSSRVALLGESAAANQITKIEVELVRSRFEPGIDELEAENRALKARVAELERGNPRIRPTELAITFGGAGEPPLADSAAATSSPSGSNVVPLQPRGQDMTDEERRERVRQNKIAAGDTPQSLRAPFDGTGGVGLYRGGVPGFGAARFDHPGWK
jgi:hypothetical protein